MKIVNHTEKLAVFRIAFFLCSLTLFFAGCHPSSNPHASANQPSDPSSGEYGTSRVGNSINTENRLLPANHTVDWLARHGQIARVQAQECSSCHTEQDCASCHIEQIAAPFQVHPPNFITIHRIDARQNLANCTDCHRVDSFCQQCHVQSKYSPIPTHTPPAGPGFSQMGFHPPGWLDSGLSNNHGVMARRNITDCASCHQEQDCVSCHIGINPHPAEFRFECRRWLEANARPCAQCHGDLSALRALCP